MSNALVSFKPDELGAADIAVRRPSVPFIALAARTGVPVSSLFEMLAVDVQALVAIRMASR